MKKQEAKKTNITKKEKQRYLKQSFEEQSEVGRIVKILIVVLIIFFSVYFITAIATGEIKFGNKKEESQETVIQYQEILAGETFTKKDASYYVLYMNFTNVMTTPLMTLADQYMAKETHDYVYFVDMDKGFNKAYAVKEGETSNAKVQNISNLKVNAPTLLKITDKKVVQYVEGYDNIKNVFVELSK